MYSLITKIKNKFKGGNLVKWRAIPGMTSEEECTFLQDLARSVSVGVIVEIGSYQGKSTIALAQGSSQGAKHEVFAIEPHEQFIGIYGAKFGPEDRQAFYEHVAASGLGQYIRLVSLKSKMAASIFDGSIGLLWIDGDHSLIGVTQDFETWYKRLSPKGVIAFDDATDPNGGPFQLIEKLIGDNVWAEKASCGKIRTIQRII